MSRGEALDWGALVSRSVHPIRLWIIEAMLWIDRPLSASELKGVFGNKLSVSAISYHMTTLARVGIVSGLEKERVRGAWKTRYVFAPAVKK
jgi:helix-turn-helix protein